MYAVKEIFLTLQGEGFHAGRLAVFVRFAGCNLWSGREEDRGKGGSCARWCDTNFRGTDGPGGGRFETAADLAHAASDAWGDRGGQPFVVLTGGEPTLQVDRALCDALRARAFTIAIETNGTHSIPAVDWITLSPKAGARVVLRGAHEVKAVWPQEGLCLDDFAEMSTHRYVQPLDGPDMEANVKACLDVIRADTRWRLSLQTHKLIGIP